MPRSKAELAREIRDYDWFHTIDLGDGLTTQGLSLPSEIIEGKGSIPDLHGKSVLDIGAWDGKYSFWAEQAGAERVVALDHFVWRLDFAAHKAYCRECEAAGVLPQPEMLENAFLVEDGTPGKAGFDLAHEYLDSSVESVVGDYMTMDLEQLGTFDVVFYFGVIYHMVNPILSLQRLLQVTGEVAVIETAAITVPGYLDSGLLELYAGNELADDYGNWFAPSEAALHALCLSAGFGRVETKAITPVNVGPLAEPGPQARPYYCRIVVQAFVDPARPSSRAIQSKPISADGRQVALIERDRWVELNAEAEGAQARAGRLRARLDNARARLDRKNARIQRLTQRLAKLEEAAGAGQGETAKRRRGPRRS